MGSKTIVRAPHEHSTGIQVCAAKGRLLDKTGTIVAFSERWYEHGLRGSAPHLREFTEYGPELSDPDDLARYYGDDVFTLERDVDRLAVVLGVNSGALYGHVDNLDKYRETTAEIFADRTRNGAGSRREVGPGSRWPKVFAALTTVGVIAGGVALVNENRPVPITDQEYQRAEDAFLEGRDDTGVSGQIEGTVSDGSRVGFVIESCGRLVLLGYNPERGMRRAGCKLDVVEVPDEAWMNYEVGDRYSRP